MGKRKEKDYEYRGASGLGSQPVAFRYYYPIALSV